MVGLFVVTEAFRVSKMVRYSKPEPHSDRNCSTIAWWSKYNATKLMIIKCKACYVFTEAIKA